MSRVAVISDVHGNAPALAAVLREVLDEEPDVLVNLGCLTWGPQPSLVASMLRSVPIPVLSVRGNGDRAVLEYVDGKRSAQTEREHHVVDSHDEDAVKLLRETTALHRLEVVGSGEVVFCHGSPRSDVELITPATSEDRLRDAIAGYDCDVVLTGHTHLQFDRKLRFVRSINPGSVGMPYHDGPPGARWAMLGRNVELRVTPYDLATAVAAARSCPGGDRWVEIITEPPSPREVIEHAEALQFSD